MIRGHGGNIFRVSQQLGCRPTDIIDMSSNVNPLGPMPQLIDHLKESLQAIRALPEVDAGSMTERYAHDCNLNPNRIIAGNGTTQFIYTLPLALQPAEMLIVGPTYSDYADACRMHRIPFRYLMAEENNGFVLDINRIATAASGCDTVVICNPNNPTGKIIPKADLEQLCLTNPNRLFIIDESYLPFAGQDPSVSMLSRTATNTVILQSLSKIFRIPGLRIGFLIADKKTVDTVQQYMQPWSVNALAQSAVGFLIRQKDAVDAFLQQTRTFIAAEKDQLIQKIAQFPLVKVHDSCTSFFLVSLPPDLPAHLVCRRLLENRILIRDCQNFEGLSENHIRISVKDKPANRLLSQKLDGILGCQKQESG